MGGRHEGQYPAPGLVAAPPRPLVAFIKGAYIAQFGTQMSSDTGRTGSVAEWSIASVLKTDEPARVPWVRIPPLP